MWAMATDALPEQGAQVLSAVECISKNDVIDSIKLSYNKYQK